MNILNECIYCGSKNPETKDHVPPKFLYPHPRPSNLITIPSCRKCNLGAGKDEEYFLATLMFTDAGTSTAGKILWDQKIRRMYTKNAGLRRYIASTFRNVKVTTPTGIYLGRNLIQSPNFNRLNIVVEKIIKGLYYFEYKERLNANTKIVSLLLLDDVAFNTVKKHINYLKLGKRGWGKVFEYKCARVISRPQGSMWLLLFYGFIVYWVVTNDKWPDKLEA